MCPLGMHVTDAHEPLMTLAGICDTGRQVVFRKDGGHILHGSSGQKSPFRRVENSYRLEVSMGDVTTGFTRQGGDRAFRRKGGQ